MKKYNYFLRGIAFLLIHSFLFEQLAFAAPDLKLAKLDLFTKPKVDLGIPESIATIEDSWISSQSHKTLYLIQDAHTNTSGQLNLSKTLDILLEKDKQIKYVFVEAGVGNNSLSFFRQYGTPQLRRQIAEPFLRIGELHGEEYLDLTSNHPFTIWGVEDLNLYKQSIQDYKYVVKEREKFQSYLQRIQATIDTLKPMLYNPSLLAFDAQYEKYTKEELPLTGYFQILQTQAQRLDIDLNTYPELKSLKDLKQKESEIDFKQANEEEAKALQSLNPQDQKELLGLAENNHSPFKLSNSDHKEDKAFYLFLEEKLNTSIKFYPQLSKYFQYLKLAKELKTQTILQEINSLQNEVFTQLATTQDEKTLLRSQRITHLLEKLFKLTMTPEEYRQYQSLTQDFNITNLTGFLNKKIMDLKTYYERAIFLESGYEEIVRHATDFYELTFKRDDHFLKETTDKMEKEEQSHAVLITGGFHTPNLKSMLKDKNVSYISITPQVMQETNQKRYEKLLLNQRTLQAGILKTLSNTLRILALETSKNEVFQALSQNLQSLVISPRFSTGARLAAEHPTESQPSVISESDSPPGKFFKEKREAGRITQTEMSPILGMKGKFYFNIEHDLQKPDADLAKKIDDAIYQLQVERFKQRRIYSRLTIKELSKAAKIKPQLITSFEHGQYVFDSQTLAKLHSAIDGLKYARLEDRLDQGRIVPERVAEVTGISGSTIKDVKNGKADLLPENWKKVHEAIDKLMAENFDKYLTASRVEISKLAAETGFSPQVISNLRKTAPYSLSKALDITYRAIDRLKGEKLLQRRLLTRVTDGEIAAETSLDPSFIYRVQLGYSISADNLLAIHKAIDKIRTQKLYRRRRAARLDQWEIAQYMGATQSYISQVELGQVQNDEIFKQIHEAIDVLQGSKLKERREKAKLSKNKLNSIAGVSSHTAVDFETAKSYATQNNRRTLRIGRGANNDAMIERLNRAIDVYTAGSVWFFVPTYGKDQEDRNFFDREDKRAATPEAQIIEGEEMKEQEENRLDQAKKTFESLHQLKNPLIRRIIELTLEGFTPKDIAKEVGLAPSQVKKNLETGVGQMRKILNVDAARLASTTINRDYANKTTRSFLKGILDLSNQSPVRVIDLGAGAVHNSLKRFMVKLGSKTVEGIAIDPVFGYQKYMLRQGKIRKGVNDYWSMEDGFDIPVSRLEKYELKSNTDVVLIQAPVIKNADITKYALQANYLLKPDGRVLVQLANEDFIYEPYLAQFFAAFMEQLQLVAIYQAPRDYPESLDTKRSDLILCFKLKQSAIGAWLADENKLKRTEIRNYIRQQIKAFKNPDQLIHLAPNTVIPETTIKTLVDMAMDYRVVFGDYRNERGQDAKDYLQNFMLEFLHRTRSPKIYTLVRESAKLLLEKRFNPSAIVGFQLLALVTISRGNPRVYRKWISVVNDYLKRSTASEIVQNDDFLHDSIIEAKNPESLSLTLSRPPGARLATLKEIQDQVRAIKASIQIYQTNKESAPDFGVFKSLAISPGQYYRFNNNSLPFIEKKLDGLEEYFSGIGPNADSLFSQFSGFFVQTTGGKPNDVKLLSNNLGTGLKAVFDLKRAYETVKAKGILLSTNKQGVPFTVNVRGDTRIQERIEYLERQSIALNQAHDKVRRLKKFITESDPRAAPLKEKLRNTKALLLTEQVKITPKKVNGNFWHQYPALLAELTILIDKILISMDKRQLNSSDTDSLKLKIQYLLENQLEESSRSLLEEDGFQAERMYAQLKDLSESILDENKNFGARLAKEPLSFRLYSEMSPEEKQVAKEFISSRMDKEDEKDNPADWRELAPFVVKDAFFAYRGDRIAGWQKFEVSLSHHLALARGLFVKEEFRGNQGIGTALRKVTIDHLKKKEIKEFAIPVDTNDSSQRFHGKLVGQKGVTPYRISAGPDKGKIDMIMMNLDVYQKEDNANSARLASTNETPSEFFKRILFFVKAFFYGGFAAFVWLFLNHSISGQMDSLGGLSDRFYIERQFSEGIYKELGKSFDALLDGVKKGKKLSGDNFLNAYLNEFEKENPRVSFKKIDLKSEKYKNFVTLYIFEATNFEYLFELFCTQKIDFSTPVLRRYAAAEKLLSDLNGKGSVAELLWWRKQIWNREIPQLLDLLEEARKEKTKDTEKKFLRLCTIFNSMEKTTSQAYLHSSPGDFDLQEINASYDRRFATSLANNTLEALGMNLRERLETVNRNLEKYPSIKNSTNEEIANDLRKAVAIRNMMARLPDYSTEDLPKTFNGIRTVFKRTDKVADAILDPRIDALVKTVHLKTADTKIRNTRIGSAEMDELLFLRTITSDYSVPNFRLDDFSTGTYYRPWAKKKNEKIGKIEEAIVGHLKETVQALNVRVFIEKDKRSTSLAEEVVKNYPSAEAPYRLYHSLLIDGVDLESIISAASQLHRLVGPFWGNRNEVIRQNDLLLFEIENAKENRKVLPKGGARLANDSNSREKLDLLSDHITQNLMSDQFQKLLMDMAHKDNISLSFVSRNPFSYQAYILRRLEDARGRDFWINFLLFFGFGSLRQAAAIFDKADGLNSIEVLHQFSLTFGHILMGLTLFTDFFGSYPFILIPAKILTLISEAAYSFHLFYKNVALHEFLHVYQFMILNRFVKRGIVSNISTWDLMRQMRQGYTNIMETTIRKYWGVKEITSLMLREFEDKFISQALERHRQISAHGFVGIYTELKQELDGARLASLKPTIPITTILIAEDNKDFQDFYQTHLSQFVVLKIVSNGQEAYDYYKEHENEVGLIITDNNMPKMSGKDLIEKIRADEEKDRKFQVPIIMASVSGPFENSSPNDLAQKLNVIQIDKILSRIMFNTVSDLVRRSHAVGATNQGARLADLPMPTLKSNDKDKTYQDVFKYLEHRLLGDSYHALVIDGITGAGKSTFADDFKLYLEKNGYVVDLVRLDKFLRRKRSPSLSNQLLFFISIILPYFPAVGRWGISKVPRLIFDHEAIQQEIHRIHRLPKKTIVIIDGFFAADMFAEVSSLKLLLRMDTARTEYEKRVSQVSRMMPWILRLRSFFMVPQPTADYLNSIADRFDRVLDVSDRNNPRWISVARLAELSQEPSFEESAEITKEIEFKNSEGLHMNPSGVISRVAQAIKRRLKIDVFIERVSPKGRQVNATNKADLFGLLVEDKERIKITVKNGNKEMRLKVMDIMERLLQDSVSLEDLPHATDYIGKIKKIDHGARLAVQKNLHWYSASVDSKLLLDPEDAKRSFKEVGLLQAQRDFESKETDLIQIDSFAAGWYRVIQDFNRFVGESLEGTDENKAYRLLAKLRDWHGTGILTSSDGRNALLKILQSLFSDEFETRFKADPVEAAVDVYEKILSFPIHVFQDQNHRMASLLMNYVLLKAGLRPFLLTINNLEAYEKATTEPVDRKALMALIRKEAFSTARLATEAEYTATRQSVAAEIIRDWPFIAKHGALVFDIRNTILKKGKSLDDAPELKRLFTDLLRTGVRILFISADAKDDVEKNIMGPLREGLGRLSKNLIAYTNMDGGSGPYWKFFVDDAGNLSKENRGPGKGKGEILSAEKDLDFQYVYYFGDEFYNLPLMMDGKSLGVSLPGKDISVAEHPALKSIHIVSVHPEGEEVPGPVLARIKHIGNNPQATQELLKLVMQSIQSSLPVGARLASLKPTIPITTILIAEDTQGFQDLYETHLSQFAVLKIVSNGQEAYDYYKEHENEVGLIITDNNMPKMNGEDLIKNIRADEEKAHKFQVPVIMVSVSGPFENISANDLAQKLNVIQIDKILSRIMFNTVSDLVRRSHVVGETNQGTRVATPRRLSLAETRALLLRDLKLLQEKAKAAAGMLREGSKILADEGEDAFLTKQLPQIQAEAKEIRTLVESISALPAFLGFTEEELRQILDPFLAEIAKKYKADKVLIWFGEGWRSDLTYSFGFSQEELKLYQLNRSDIYKYKGEQKKANGREEEVIQIGKELLSELSIQDVIEATPSFKDWRAKENGFVTIILGKSHGKFENNEEENLSADLDLLLENKQAVWPAIHTRLTELKYKDLGNLMTILRHNSSVDIWRIGILHFLDHLEGWINEVKEGKADRKKITKLVSTAPDWIEGGTAKDNAFIELLEKGDKFQTTDVAPIIKDRIGIYKKEIEAKGLKFEFAFDPGEMVAESIDTNILKLVIDNLLQNAIKYADHGEIKIRLYKGDFVPSYSGGFNKEGILLSVTDTGIGIPKDELSKVFNSGIRGSNATNRPGEGIGLNFISSALAVMRGDIQVESEIGKGSMFTVFLKPSENKAEGARSADNSFSHATAVVMPPSITHTFTDDEQNALILFILSVLKVQDRHEASFAMMNNRRLASVLEVQERTGADGVPQIRLEIVGTGEHIDVFNPERELRNRRSETNHHGSGEYLAFLKLARMQNEMALGPQAMTKPLRIVVPAYPLSRIRGEEEFTSTVVSWLTEMTAFKVDSHDKNISFCLAGLSGARRSFVQDLIQTQKLNGLITLDAPDNSFDGIVFELLDASRSPSQKLRDQRTLTLSVSFGQDLRSVLLTPFFSAAYAISAAHQKAYHHENKLPVINFAEVTVLPEATVNFLRTFVPEELHREFNNSILLKMTHGNLVLLARFIMKLPLIEPGIDKGTRALEMEGRILAGSA